MLTNIQYSQNNTNMSLSHAKRVQALKRFKYYFVFVHSQKCKQSKEEEKEEVRNAEHSVDMIENKNLRSKLRSICHARMFLYLVPNVLVGNGIKETTGADFRLKRTSSSAPTVILF